MTRRPHQLLAIGGVRGAVEPLEQVLRTVPEATAAAVAVVGDLCPPSSTRDPSLSKCDLYRSIFKVLGESERPVFWVPGAGDAPINDYLTEAYNLEIVYPALHAVHGTVAVGPDNVVYGGMGGQIDDDPSARRDEESLLRYPSWEVEYRLKVMREFDGNQIVLLFSTPPAHEAVPAHGSEVIAELIKSYNPRVAITGGERPAQGRLAHTLVVSPGRFDRGEYALINSRRLTVSMAGPAGETK